MDKQIILNIIGDEEYPVGWVIEQIRRNTNLSIDYPIEGIIS